MHCMSYVVDRRIAKDAVSLSYTSQGLPKHWQPLSDPAKHTPEELMTPNTALIIRPSKLLPAPQVISLATDDGMTLLDAWRVDIETQRSAILRTYDLRRQVIDGIAQITFHHSDMRPMNPALRGEARQNRMVHAFWSSILPATRTRVCRAIGIAYVQGGLSNAVARDLKQGLYYAGTLNRNHWSYLLVLLAYFPPRELLMRFCQGSAVLALDILKARLEHP